MSALIGSVDCIVHQAVQPVSWIVCEAGDDTGVKDMRFGYPADVKAGCCTQQCRSGSVR